MPNSKSTKPAPAMFAVVAFHVTTSAIFFNLAPAFWTFMHIFWVYPFAVKLFLVWLTRFFAMFWLFTHSTSFFLAYVTNLIFLPWNIQNALAIRSRAKYHIFILSNFSIFVELHVLFIAVLTNNWFDFCQSWFCFASIFWTF